MLGGRSKRPEAGRSPALTRQTLRENTARAGGGGAREGSAGREGEGRRARGPGGELTHADVSQLGRAQLDVPENRGQDGREELVGGGVLQREAWPR